MGILETAVRLLDVAITDLFSQWNSYSTILTTLIVLLVTYWFMNRRDPDTHPVLLARQAVPSHVRHEGHSAVYRSRLTPDGMPLSTGLDVRDPGALKWTRGRDGDLRDVWRKVIAGVPEDEGGAGVATGRILTVLGSELVVEHKLADITHQINSVGQHIVQQGGRRVAFYLPNSVELLAGIFACSFYGLTAIVLPFGCDNDSVVDMLRRSSADTIVTIAATVSMQPLLRSYSGLRGVILVLDKGNQHLDWTENPSGIEGDIKVSTWSAIVKRAAQSSLELPQPSSNDILQPIVMFWSGKSLTSPEMVEFTHGNIVSGMSGQLAAIPTMKALSASDLLLVADALSNIHTLVLTLTALYSNASIAVNAVAGGCNDLTQVSYGVAPTVVVASPSMLLGLHKEAVRKLTPFPRQFIHNLQTRSLTRFGVMPSTSWNDSLWQSVGTTPGKLRLIFVAERAGAGTVQLSPAILSDLRIFTGAHIVYALSSARVAGAVTQTDMFDYRVDKQAKCSHFGAPLVCDEILLQNQGYHITTDETIEGEILVRGPCVAGGQASVGSVGKIGEDCTLAFVEHQR